MNQKIDFVDKLIIEQLQEDSRISLSDLATKVNLAVSSTGERIKRLQTMGVIEEFTCIVNPKKLGFEICSFIQVFINPDMESQFLEKILELPEVLECHFITGEYSYLLKVRVKSTAELEKFLSSSLNKLPGIGKSNSMISLSAFKETQKIFISEKSN